MALTVKCSCWLYLQFTCLYIAGNVAFAFELKQVLYSYITVHFTVISAWLPSMSALNYSGAANNDF